MFTWNVATLDPPEGDILKDLVWIHTKDCPDMYLVTLQEVSSKPHEVIQTVVIDDPWTAAISNQVCNRGYVLVSSNRLQGLLILLYARMLHLPFLHNIHTACTRTGLGGVWGNKGAASIRLDCYGRSLCFVSVHMAPHQDQWDQRDKEYYQIVANQSYPLTNTPHILYHDYIFWLGDLNYRFEDLGAESVKFLSAPNKLHVLREKDQLLLTIREKRAFDQFQEGTLSFIPTYKYDLGQNVFDSSPKQRIPAWTDRILWRVNKAQTCHPAGTVLKLKQMTYTSHGDVLWSDHKPVWADFLVQVSSEVVVPRVVFDPIESWNKNEVSNCLYTIAMDTKTSSWDWIGLYKIGFQTVQRSYCTYEWAVQVDSETHKRTHCKVRFSPTYLPSDFDAKYVLCYNSRAMNCVLGVSNVFRIKPPAESS